jgi:hypothetical protein
MIFSIRLTTWVCTTFVARGSQDIEAEAINIRHLGKALLKSGVWTFLPRYPIDIIEAFSVPRKYKRTEERDNILLY